MATHMTATTAAKVLGLLHRALSDTTEKGKG